MTRSDELSIPADREALLFRARAQQYDLNIIAAWL
jgi:hypothetical protein